MIAARRARVTIYATCAALSLSANSAHACMGVISAYRTGSGYLLTAANPLAAVQPDRFGALAASVDGRRYFVMSKADCYDLSSFKIRGDIRFIFNHRLPQDSRGGRPTYIGFQVVRAAAQLPSSYVAVYRNRSRTPESLWILPKDLDALGRFVSGTISPEQGVIYTDRYEKEIDAAENATALLESLNTNFVASTSKLGAWHALVGTPDGTAPSWTVATNTLRDHTMWRLPAEALTAMTGDAKFVVRNYILKYTPTAAPKAPVKFKVNIEGVSCVYIKPIARAEDLLRIQINTPLVLRLTADAKCLEAAKAFRS
jgi:hypothetical protein